METVDPREVVKKTFEILEILPPNTFSIRILTSASRRLGFGIVNYTIKKISGGIFQVTEDFDGTQLYTRESKTFTISNYHNLKTILKRYPIVYIILETTDELGGHQVTLFDCENTNCMDIKNQVAAKIQNRFRKSKGYAEMMYHPLRLEKLGYFNDLSFGKRKVCQNGALKIVNSEIKYVSKLK